MELYVGTQGELLDGDLAFWKLEEIPSKTVTAEVLSISITTKISYMEAGDFWKIEIESLAQLVPP